MRARVIGCTAVPQVLSAAPSQSELLHKYLGMNESLPKEICWSNPLEENHYLQVFNKPWKVEINLKTNLFSKNGILSWTCNHKTSFFQPAHILLPFEWRVGGLMNLGRSSKPHKDSLHQLAAVHHPRLMCPEPRSPVTPGGRTQSHWIGRTPCSGSVNAPADFSGLLIPFS